MANKSQDEPPKKRRSFFELLTELFGWLQIVASPLLAGLVVGLIIYLVIPNTIGNILGIAVAIIGLIFGVIWATRIWKKKGTVDFVSKIMATPELDEKEEVVP